MGHIFRQFVHRERGTNGALGKCKEPNMPPNEIGRRELLQGSSALALAVACSRTAEVPKTAIDVPNNTANNEGDPAMKSITTRDGVSLFYKDWGQGQPIVFSHGWPLSADAWENQLLYFGLNGYRVIAHDRRGHGRSSQTWDGNDMDTYADDLAALIEKLELKNAVLVGHSTGGGEVTRYLGRHGTKRAAKAVLASAIPPLMLKTEANPGGLPKSAFDAIRTGVSTNRSQFYKDLAFPFHGANRSGARVPQGLLDQFWIDSMRCGIKPAIDCI